MVPLADRAAIVWTCSPDWAKMTVPTDREVGMDAELNPAQRLHALGQSLWLDSINRVMLRTGALARYVRDLAVKGGEAYATRPRQNR